MSFVPWDMKARSVKWTTPMAASTKRGGTAFFNRQLIKSLSVNMEIKDLKNIGTEAAPRPGFTARVKVTPSFIFNSPWVRTCEVK